MISHIFAFVGAFSWYWKKKFFFVNFGEEYWDKGLHWLSLFCTKFLFLSFFAVACSFFVSTILILCTVTVICTATPVMRLGRRGSGGSAEGLRLLSSSNQSRERHRIASQYFGGHDRLEWHNPCGGVYEPNGQPPQRNPDLELKLFKDVSHLKSNWLVGGFTNEVFLQLKIPVGRTVDTINRVRGEDHKQLDRWAKWENSYTFLPILVSWVFFIFIILHLRVPNCVVE